MYYKKELNVLAVKTKCYEMSKAKEMWVILADCWVRRLRGAGTYGKLWRCEFTGVGFCFGGYKENWQPNISFVIHKRSFRRYSTSITHSLIHSRRYNTCRVLADSRSRLHPSLSLVLLLQFVIPSLSAPPVTPSIHLRFGPPARLLPSGLSKVIFFHGRLSCIRTICPAHIQPLLCGLNSKKMLCLDTRLKIKKDSFCILFQLDKSAFFGGALAKWKISVRYFIVAYRTESY
jgi:hypothetical protein